MGKTLCVQLTLLETFQFLKSCHRRAPFLFFNGNTFAEIGRGGVSPRKMTYSLESPYLESTQTLNYVRHQLGALFII
jgi:hypothetical protein